MLYLFEGMDKVGKTTAAETVRKKIKGEIVHMGVPSKWHTPETYFAECLHKLALTAKKNVVFDRTFFGELIWPSIYGRSAMLSEDKVATLLQAAHHMHPDGVHLIYMHDPDKEAHIARMEAFGEPVYKYDEASSIHREVLAKNNFQFITYPEAVKIWG